MDPNPCTKVIRRLAFAMGLGLLGCNVPSQEFDGPTQPKGGGSAAGAGRQNQPDLPEPRDKPGRASTSQGKDNRLMISKSAAVEIARKRLHNAGGSLPKGTPIVVDLNHGVYTVTFVYIPQPYE